MPQRETSTHKNTINKLLTKTIRPNTTATISNTKRFSFTAIVSRRRRRSRTSTSRRHTGNRSSRFVDELCCTSSHFSHSSFFFHWDLIWNVRNIVSYSLNKTNFQMKRKDKITLLHYISLGWRNYLCYVCRLAKNTPISNGD